MDTNQANTVPQEAACASSNAPQPIAVVRSYDALRRVVADWCEQNHITRAELDAEAGLTDGHAGKLLASKARKKLGMVSLGRVMAAAGLVLIVAVDPEAPLRITAASNTVSKARPKHWRRQKGSSWGRRMAMLRALKLSGPQRSEIARHAAHARHRRRQAASAPSDAAE
jgi:hypothetical protein